MFVKINQKQEFQAIWFCHCSKDGSAGLFDAVIGCIGLKFCSSQDECNNP